jgi:threonine dehydrogenase-like Zn-dependent dehydrogenase
MEKNYAAAVMRNKKIQTVEIPSPEPRPGEFLVKTLACGICGSDLHALKFADKLIEGDAAVMDLKAAS